MKHVELYTDGSSLGNPGPGGYGAILIFNQKRLEMSEGFTCTTNNRMELLAVIVGLEQLKFKCRVDVYSDSKYVVDAVEKKWVFGWEKKNFAAKKNPDLWKRFLIIFRQHDVHFFWVKGHNGHPENERCDHLAVQAAHQQNLNVDKGYSAL